MTVPLLPLRPTSEMVAVAWIASIDGLTPDMAGEKLPPDVDPQGNPAGWLTTGFATVVGVGGTPHDLQPVRRPVVQVDVYTAKPGSNKPPWQRAAMLAEVIQRATWDLRRIPRLLPITYNGVTYPSAFLRSAYMATEFRRLYDDSADYARFQGDLALNWVIANDRID